MLKHNLSLFFRNIKKYKSTFLINIFGLSASMTCVLLIALWVIDELQFDKFHGAQVYQIMEVQKTSNGLSVQDVTPGPLAESISLEVPLVEAAVTTTSPSSYGIGQSDDKFKQEGIAAGSDFFNVFSFPLLQGSKSQVLDGTNSVVISNELAIKLFGDSKDCIGKSVEIQSDEKEQFLVTGVFENVPNNSSLQFDFVFSFKKYQQWYPWVLNWKNNGVQTFTTLKNGASKDAFDSQIVDMIKNNGGEEYTSLFAKQFSEKYLYGNYRDGKQIGGRIEYVWLFSIIAAFILLIACVNFTNLSTANANRRMDEIGIKKALGSKRGSLIIQYLGESLMLCFFSLIVSLVFVAVLLSSFNQITGKQLFLNFNLVQIGTIILITLVTGLLAGLYPAFYLSKFKAITILRGRLKGSLGEVLTRKGLVIFQFSISIILIVSVWVVYQQIQYIQNQNLGFTKDNIIQFEKLGNLESNTEYFKSEALKVPGILSVSSINHGLAEGGYSSSTNALEWKGRDLETNIEMESVMVDYDMLALLEIDIEEGRSFSKSYNDYNTTIIFNQAAIAAMGIDDPIGKSVFIGGKEKEIIGVAEDFHFRSFRESIDPLFFMLRPERAWLMMVKVAAGKEKSAISGLERLHKSLNPEYDLDYKFIDKDIDAQYKSEHRVASLSKYFAVLAMLISCLGLFGLATFTAERRRKEISIRKVLGQTTSQVSIMLSKEFAKLVLISIVIALPISYFLASNWLSEFAYRTPIKLWWFFCAGFIALLIAILTVGSLAVRAARLNPVDGLRDS
ncbi:ABC transporter permease [Dokdonia sp.]|uniref:ABC transporter permease n=1 Tax=Dokdonia sp. TaxID=2024995 RepID=UPI0032661E12